MVSRKPNNLQKIIKHGVDGRALLNYNQQNLKDLGFKDKNLLLEKIKELRGQNAEKFEETREAELAQPCPPGESDAASRRAKPRQLTDAQILLSQYTREHKLRLYEKAKNEYSASKFILLHNYADMRYGYKNAALEYLYQQCVVKEKPFETVRRELKKDLERIEADVSGEPLSYVNGQTQTHVSNEGPSRQKSPPSGNQQGPPDINSDW